MTKTEKSVVYDEIAISLWEFRQLCWNAAVVDFSASATSAQISREWAKVDKYQRGLLRFLCPAKATKKGKR